MEFDDYSITGIEKEIKRHFTKTYKDIEEDDIVYINPTWDIREYFQVSTKYETYQTEIGVVEAYNKNQKITIEQYKEYTKKSKEERPKDFPMRVKYFVLKEIIDYDKVKEEMKTLKARMEVLEKQATDEADLELQKKQFTGIIFIVLNNAW